MESQVLKSIGEFAEFGWVGIILCLIVFAWKPTIGYLTDFNHSRISHAEKLIESMQKEIRYLREELKRINDDLDIWKKKYYKLLSKEIKK